jgi:ribonuclease BN (tRNA processing enzyme)
VRTLTVLGCDGSWPGPGGAGSGYLVQAGGTNLLLDAGPGTFAALQGWIDPASIAAVVLSHSHPDHWSDLESFAVWAGFGPGRATLPVWAPADLRRWSHFAEATWLEWHELTPATELSWGTLIARFDRTDHSVPTMAVRFEHEGGTLAYSADTGPAWDPAAAWGAGLGSLLCEATYTEASEGTLPHLSGRQAGTLARAAGAKRLILTHRWPTVSADAVRQEAEQAFGRSVDQAIPGAVFEW